MPFRQFCPCHMGRLVQTAIGKCDDLSRICLIEIYNINLSSHFSISIGQISTGFTPIALARPYDRSVAPFEMGIRQYSRQN